MFWLNLEILHGILQLQVLSFDFLQQTVVDYVHVLEPDGQDSQDHSADEDGHVPDHPDPVTHGLTEIHSDIIPIPLETPEDEQDGGVTLSSKNQDFFLLNLKSSKNQEFIRTISWFQARSDNLRCQNLNFKQDPRI